MKEVEDDIKLPDLYNSFSSVYCVTFFLLHGNDIYALSHEEM